MEQPSMPEGRSPEEIRPTYVRPPGLEFAMGMALFAITLLVFFLVQTGAFITAVIDRSPELTAGGFRLGMIGEPWFQERMQHFTTNGDVLSHAALWSGLIGALFVLGAVALWKGSNTYLFLGLRPPGVGPLVRWIGIFLLLGVAIELLAHLFPVFDTDFMQQVVDSSTQRWKLFLGVGLMAPLFEEFLLRGLLFGSLRHLLDEHRTVAITAGVFALMHLQYSWSIMLLIVPIGVVLGYARSRSGSIWVPVALHVMNNTVSVFLP